jgi:hypothetical protein
MFWNSIFGFLKTRQYISKLLELNILIFDI